VTLKAYLENIESQTGKTPKDFRVLAEKKGLLRESVKTGQIVSWLKEDYGLGRGHAMAIVLTLRNATQPRSSRDEQVAKHFSGAKDKWRKPYGELFSKVKKFGSDVSVAPTNSYISLVRKGKKFGIVQVTSDRLDIGIKLKGAKATRRFQPAGAWNNMVTHRVHITNPNQIDSEVLGWLRHAFDAASAARSRTANS
jgi:hypothetical protein